MNGAIGAASPAATITVALLVPRTLIREGLAALIQQRGDVRVIGQAGDPEQAGRLGVVPDVVVADIELDGLADEGVVLHLRALFPRSGIVVLTTVAHPARVQAALDAGAAGYLLKTSASSHLRLAIRAVAHGESYLESSLGVALSRWRDRRQTDGLSPTEEQVLALLAVGHTNAHVAQHLQVSLRTVESHRARLKQKLGCRTRADFFSYACTAELIEPL